VSTYTPPTGNVVPMVFVAPYTPDPGNDVILNFCDPFAPGTFVGFVWFNAVPIDS
jgi:hypothetical protein